LITNKLTNILADLYILFLARATEEVPAFMKEFAGVVRRRSSGGGVGFNPNESAPPKPDSSARPQSAVIPQARYKVQPVQPVPVQSSRRKSDFMERYEELTIRAAAAMKRADSVVEGANSGPAEIEFNEEEVLKTCQDFIKDYDQSKQRRSLTEGQMATMPPVPKPRDSLARKQVAMSEPLSMSLTSSPSRLHRAKVVEGPTVLHAAPVPSVRNRSASLTVLDKRSPPPPAQFTTQQSENLNLYPRPILKKSSEDLSKLDF
jgi:hypothetical protein